jgi:hypothetical protein
MVNKLKSLLRYHETICFTFPRFDHPLNFSIFQTLNDKQVDCAGGKLSVEKSFTISMMLTFVLGNSFCYEF